jgi:hypothetical protein
MFWNLTVGDSVRVVPHLKPAEYVHSKDKKEDYMKRYGLDLIRPKKVIDPTSTPWVTHDYSVEVPEGRHQPPMIYRIKRTHKRANVCVLEYQAPYELKYDEFGNPENPDDEGKLRWVELDVCAFSSPSLSSLLLFNASVVADSLFRFFFSARVATQH